MWGDIMIKTSKFVRVVVVSLSMAFALAGCSTLGWVDRYDASTVADINAYHIKAVAFISASEKDAGLPAGLATSERSKTFYSEQGAVLANLVVRADALNSGRICPIEAIRALLTVVDEATGEAAAAAPAEPAGCTVIVLRHLQAVHESLEEIHESEGYLRPPVSSQAQAQVGDAVRIALRNEEEKR